MKLNRGLRKVLVLILVAVTLSIYTPMSVYAEGNVNGNTGGGNTEDEI